MLKYVMSILLCFGASHIHSFSYMNGKDVSLRTIMTEACYVNLDYNILNSGDGHLSEHKRYFGMHNFSVQIDGYETVHLIKDDVCQYPELFTMLGSVLPQNFFLTQRWACVKWLLPLSFGFKIRNNQLIVYSSIFSYSFLAPFLTTEKIDLVKTNSKSQCIDSRDAKFVVSVNGRTVVVGEEEVVQVHNSVGRDFFDTFLAHIQKSIVTSVFAIVGYGLVRHQNLSY